ncbi:Barrel-sandwich domain of CusB or HlyD membrane-fusion [Solimonas aquatica]|uniref:Barrel-sandwich domain of CusB or HlyD membrane-fusion n=1 Tax=Solimonas aquatica TaxID=489703 RepID=A0A1H9FP85_9GAMM|nr:HlyD family efflux transporter periplasmic adaptor subunit [Solimonas aquatica]SEQ39692.1 Barrel-sandwich domain of CusB or HlyD membrane-fusion [Solimonas aquatica]
MRRALPLLMLLLALPGAAHEGEDHGAAPAAGTGVAAVRWLGPDQLLVPKSVQRLLAIRTQPATQDRLLRQQRAAEVLATPASTGALRAPQAGRLEAAGAWPQPGRRVQAGELLAWLRPLLSQRDQAQRRTQLAEIEQKLQVARINAERLRVQGEAAPGLVTNENVYREQAELELEALQKRRELEDAALSQRMPIRAAQSGLLYEATVSEGEVVASGQALFAIAETDRAWLAVASDQPREAQRLRSAQLLLDDQALPLTWRGQQPADNGRFGWRLLFEISAPLPRPLLPGELLSAQLETVAEPAAVLDAPWCVPAETGVLVWEHRDAEHFLRHRYASCAQALAQAGSQTRWVTQGAALLSQYR